MVSRIMTGKSVRGAVNYNEHKVAEGKATFLAAEGYLKSPELLSISDKLWVLDHRIQLNERTKTNCVHISLNFSMDERIDNNKLCAIADSYISAIGFEGQPYLVYRHLDAAHEHIHIVTTNIQADGKAIRLHNIGRDKSEKARKEIEKTFGLVPAEKDQSQKIKDALKPVSEKVAYGKSETKSAVSNTVRAIVRDYKFTSLAELNAVLKGFNVEAYRGEIGTRMYEKGGLTYHVLDRKGNRMGVPIKSSSIYTKPTLKYLESIFLANKNKKQFHKSRLQRSIDKVLLSPVKDRFAFRLALKKENIDVLYRENESMVYGITFIDHNTKCVFNGSDLGKNYSAKSLLDRIIESGNLETQRQEQDHGQLQSYIRDFNYAKSPQQSVEQLYALGYKLNVLKNDYGNDRYCLSFQDGNSSVQAAGLSRFDRHFEQGGVTESLVRHINEHIAQYGVVQLQLYIQHLFAERSATYFGHTTADKKKPRKKVNW